MPKKSEEITQQLQTIATEVMNLYDQKKTADPNVWDFTEEDIQTVRTKTTEMENLKKDLNAALEIERMAENAKAIHDQINMPQNLLPFPGLDPRVAAGLAEIAPKKSLGQQFIESEAFTKFNPQQKQGPAVELEFEHKATLDEATGFAPQAVRIARIEAFPVRQLVVADLIPQATTDQIAIVYMEETTFTNAAAETAEAAAKPESTLAFTERTSTVRKIATVLPVTEELMQDVSGMRGYINQRLIYMVQQREDTQIISGNGTAPNLRGLLNVVGIQTQAKGADTVQDAIYKAITLVRSVGFAEPSGVVIHPTDWQGVRLAKTTTGEYIWGHPALPGPETLFGLPVVSTTAISQGTALTADFRGFVMIFRKSGITVAVSDSHSDFFIKNLLAVRAEERLALVAFRPKAICSITGL